MSNEARGDLLRDESGEFWPLLTLVSDPGEVFIVVLVDDDDGGARKFGSFIVVRCQVYLRREVLSGHFKLILRQLTRNEQKYPSLKLFQFVAPLMLRTLEWCIIIIQYETGRHRAAMANQTKSLFDKRARLAVKDRTHWPRIVKCISDSYISVCRVSRRL